MSVEDVAAAAQAAAGPEPGAAVPAQAGPPEPVASPATAEAVADRVLASALGTADLLAIYVGDRLGWYRSLAADGPASATELAGRTGTDARYAREWLEQQAVTGLLAVEPDGAGPAAERRFSLPPAAAEVLTDERSLAYLGPIPRLFAAAAQQLPGLLEAYRRGGGVRWADLGADAREGQADVNRPLFERELAGALRSVEPVDAVLRRPGAKVADIGCGAAWSSIALARAYPQASVDAVDVDEPTVELARANVAGSDVSGRVRVSAGDAAGLAAASYDAVFAFECLHDLPHPVQALTAARRALVPGGSVVVMDEAVADELTAPGDEVERLMYAYSLFLCLPDAMAYPDSAATGTVMRPATLRHYATEAGFSAVEVLPIEDFGFFRFYRLTP